MFTDAFSLRLRLGGLPKPLIGLEEVDGVVFVVEVDQILEIVVAAMAHVDVNPVDELPFAHLAGQQSGCRLPNPFARHRGVPAGTRPP